MSEPVTQNLQAALEAGDAVSDGLIMLLRYLDDAVEHQNLAGVAHILQWARRVGIPTETSRERHERLTLDQYEREFERT